MLGEDGSQGLVIYLRTEGHLGGSVKHLLIFGSGHDFMAHEFKPTIALSWQYGTCLVPLLCPLMLSKASLKKKKSGVMGDSSWGLKHI